MIERDPLDYVDYILKEELKINAPVLLSVIKVSKRIDPKDKSNFMSNFKEIKNKLMNMNSNKFNYDIFGVLIIGNLFIIIRKTRENTHKIYKIYQKDNWMIFLDGYKKSVYKLPEKIDEVFPVKIFQ